MGMDSYGGEGQQFEMNESGNPKGEGQQIEINEVDDRQRAIGAMGV
jgi:hypothetical protein